MNRRRIILLSAFLLAAALIYFAVFYGYCTASGQYLGNVGIKGDGPDDPCHWKYEIICTEQDLEGLSLIKDPKMGQIKDPKWGC